MTKLFTAMRASIRFLARVGSDVTHKLTTRPKAFFTMIAREGPLSRVDSHVHKQCGIPMESFVTLTAHV